MTGPGLELAVPELVVAPPAGQARAGLRFAPVHPLRAHESVAEQIRRHMALRLIGHGEALPPERELAEMFGVSRRTVQLALGSLEADHLAETRRGRRGGTFVLQPTETARGLEELTERLLRRRREISELLVYRAAIEPAAARLAARLRRDSDLAAMRRALVAMGSAASEPEYMRHDTAFHVALARATGNRYLTRDVERIRVELNDALRLLPESDRWHRRLEDEHAAIFGAVVAGDVDAVQTAVELHVANSNRGVRAVLRSIQRRQAAGSGPAEDGTA